MNDEKEPCPYCGKMVDVGVEFHQCSTCSTEEGPSITLEDVKRTFELVHSMLPVIYYLDSEYMPIFDKKGERMILGWSDRAPDGQPLLLLHPGNLEFLKQQIAGVRWVRTRPVLHVSFLDDFFR